MRREAVSLRAVALEDRDAFRLFERQRDALYTLLEQHGFPPDPKGRLSGERLGPITLSIVNAADRAPAVKHFQENMLAIYAGFSPELERFCTLNLWPGISGSATIVFNEVRTVAEQSGALLELQGKYQVEPPNALFPWFARHAAPSSAVGRFYDWRFFPYAKRNGEELVRPPAPMACRRLHLRDRRGDIFPCYGELVTVAATIGQVRGNGVELYVPRLWPEAGWSRVIVSLTQVSSKEVCERIGSLMRGQPLTALLLRDHHGASAFVDVDETSELGLVAHVLARELHARYVAAVGLRVASWEELEMTLGRCALAVSRMLRRAVTGLEDTKRSFALLRPSYLYPFFEIDASGAIARPRVLGDPSLAQLLDADRQLSAAGMLMAPLDVIALRKAEHRLLAEVVQRR